MFEMQGVRHHPLLVVMEEFLHKVIEPKGPFVVGPQEVRLGFLAGFGEEAEAPEGTASTFVHP